MYQMYVVYKVGILVASEVVDTYLLPQYLRCVVVPARGTTLSGIPTSADSPHHPSGLHT